MNNNIIFVIAGILIFIFILFCLCNKRRENFAYSGYRATGCKNKDICKRYYWRHYLNCVKNSGGRDVQGNCWQRIVPYLIACDYNPY